MPSSTFLDVRVPASSLVPPRRGFALTFVSMPPDEGLVRIARDFATSTGRPSSARLERMSDGARYRAHVRDASIEACVEHEDPHVALGTAFDHLETMPS